MKIFIISLLFSVLASTAYCQTINYEKSFDVAIAKASTQNKLVFLLVTVAPKSMAGFKTGLDIPKVADQYNHNFICYRTFVSDTASARLRENYPTEIYPAYFFIDKNGNLVYKDMKNSELGQRYINMADSALKEESSGKTLSDYEAVYKTQKVDAVFLKRYITLREKLGLHDNAKLIDEYVGYLPVSALDNYQEVLFIFKAGPIAFGKAYTLCATNKKLPDSVYRTEPLADRIAINNNIINNTFKAAVSKKDAGMAQSLSNFIRNTYGNDYSKGAKEYSRNLVSYYYQVKDTTNYLQQASYFYDTYYMNISADSAKKLLVEQRADFLKKMNKGKIAIDTLKKPQNGANTTVVRMTLGVLVAPQEVTTTLNNAARGVYSTGTHNPNYIIKAITWSRRAIAMNEQPGYHDTLAHLLYRYGFYSEAESEQNLAINGTPHTSADQLKYFKTELTKIKDRVL